MSIHDYGEKINPFRNREGSQRPSVSNGVKQFFDETISSEKGKDILVIAVVILVGLFSFELGRLSKAGGSSGVKVEYKAQNQETNVASVTPKDSESQSASKNVVGKTVSKNTSNPPTIPLVLKKSRNFFASNRGNKFYPADCSAGKNIKIENRIYFETKEEAVRAGYELSSSCQ